MQTGTSHDTEHMPTRIYIIQTNIHTHTHTSIRANTCTSTYIHVQMDACIPISVHAFSMMHNIIAWHGIISHGITSHIPSHLISWHRMSHALTILRYSWHPHEYHLEPCDLLLCVGAYWCVSLCVSCSPWQYMPLVSTPHVSSDMYMHMYGTCPFASSAPMCRSRRTCT